MLKGESKPLTDRTKRVLAQISQTKQDIGRKVAFKIHKMMANVASHLTKKVAAHIEKKMDDKLAVNSKIMGDFNDLSLKLE